MYRALLISALLLGVSFPAAAQFQSPRLAYAPVTGGTPGQCAVWTDTATLGSLSCSVIGGMAIGGTVSGGMAGSVLFVGAGPVLAQDHTGFHYDGAGGLSTNGFVEVDGSTGAYSNINASGNFTTDCGSTVGCSVEWEMDRNGSAKWGFWNNQAASGDRFTIEEFTNNTNKIDIAPGTSGEVLLNQSGGNVGIGVAPGSTGAKLDVNGGIRLDGSPNVDLANAGGAGLQIDTGTFVTGSSIKTGGSAGDGVITLVGHTSGQTTLAVPDAAGTAHIIELPTTNGNSGQVLQTDGGAPANTSWVTVPVVQGTVRAVAQVAAITTTTGFTVGASNAEFEANFAIDCTTTSAAATVNVTIGWTDTGSQAQTATLGSAIVCTTLGAASFASLSLNFNAKAATNITYATAIVNTPTYDIRGTFRQLTIN